VIQLNPLRRRCDVTDWKATKKNPVCRVSARLVVARRDRVPVENETSETQSVSSWSSIASRVCTREHSRNIPARVATQKGDVTMATDMSTECTLKGTHECSSSNFKGGLILMICIEAVAFDKRGSSHESNTIRQKKGPQDLRGNRSWY
jgi:hypothetical protein